MITKDSVTPPEFALDLYPNKALLFDPHIIGKIQWPNMPSLPADLNLALTNYFYDLIGNDEFAPAHHGLHSLYYLTGVLSFNISFYHLAQSKTAGFFRDETKPLLTMGDGARTKESENVLKDFIATKGQKFLLRAASIFGMRPNITLLANTSIYPEKQFGKIFRIRRPEAILSIEKTHLNAQEQSSAKKLSAAIFAKAISLAHENNIDLDDDTKNSLQAYVAKEVLRANKDLKAVKKFIGYTKCIYFERSLTPYLQSLISTACRHNGGQAYSTFHGVCQTASEPDVATMANASVFWGVSEAFTDDAKELSEKIPEKIRHYEIKNLGQEDHYKKYLKNDSPRKEIRHVAIMGRHIVMRTSAFNTLEFPAYLDIENKMCSLLLAHGYEVTYKAHPECSWRHFDQFFDPRVKIDWRPFEGVMNEFDALYYHFGASSTLPHALGSHLHIFMLADGWHDVRIWPSRIQNFYRQYCNMLAGRINENGLIDFNAQDVLNAFKNPVAFDKEKRIQDFFNKRMF